MRACRHVGIEQGEDGILADGIQQDLTEGSVAMKLAQFALPFLASSVVQSLYSFADMLIVGRFSGPISMSGVNIGGQVTLFLTNIVIGMCVGVTVLIGQHAGAGKQELLRKAASTALAILPLAAIALTVLMLVFKRPLLVLIQTPPESFAESDRYLSVTVSGLVFIFGYNAFSAILRGMGDSKHPFFFVLAACATNVALDLLFVVVFHWDAFGAALATVISQALSVSLCIGFLAKNKRQLGLQLAPLEIDSEQLTRILVLGLPTSVANSIVNISFVYITAIVNIVGGVYASAAVGAANKFNSFAFMPALAISAAISAMAAQNIGAGQLGRAVQATRLGTAVSFLLMGSFFVFVQLYPAQVISIFGNDPNMARHGVAYMRSFSFDFLVLPFVFCLNALFTAGGHTLFTLASSIFTSILLRVPICWLFGAILGWGMFGVGMAAPTASVGALVASLCFLASGRWKHNVALGAGAATDASAFIG